MKVGEQMATIEDLQRLDIRTGVIVAVEDFPRARTPAYRVTVDFGPEIGAKQSSAQATNYAKDELIGLHVVGIVNFPPRNIAGFLSEVLILGVPGADGAVSILTPSRPAKLGGAVY
jgi:tRNA-binding protein